MSKGPLFAAEERVSLYYSQCWIGAFLVVDMKKLRQKALIIMTESWKMLLTGSLLTEIGKLVQLSSVLKMRMQRPLLLYQSLKSLRPELLELSKQIKEILKGADQYGGGGGWAGC
ncbi:hypothetical protein SLEP1_g51950 [Rubroshorea leprosula]|uniref:Uncharacterized protein n=2 Tax=Rubroshorea leprosula TaxID=152421 RepID=A0AAV5M7D5_9ROSI|nr:hypothetical protein SLEP1_g51950 [Rubroshorea leprosula]